MFGYGSYGCLGYTAEAGKHRKYKKLKRCNLVEGGRMTADIFFEEWKEVSPVRRHECGYGNGFKTRFLLSRGCQRMKKKKSWRNICG